MTTPNENVTDDNTMFSGAVSLTDERIGQLATIMYRLRTGVTQVPWASVALGTKQALHTQARDWLRAAVIAGLLPSTGDIEAADSYASSTGAAYAWHALRLYQGEHPFDPGLHNLYEVGHSAQCETLPPGASCWFAQEPNRSWWPAGDQYGTYRVRTTWWLIGTGPGGEDPEPVEGFDIQVLDEATGTWSDWTGTTMGEATANQTTGEAAAAGYPADVAEAIARVQAFADAFTAEGWNHVAATSPWTDAPNRKTLKTSDLRTVLGVLAQPPAGIPLTQRRDDGRG